MPLFKYIFTNILFTLDVVVSVAVFTFVYFELLTRVCNFGNIFTFCISFVLNYIIVIITIIIVVVSY